MSSSNARLASHALRRATDDRDSMPPTQQSGMRDEKDSRKESSRSRTNHRKTTSNRGVEERRTARSQVTTRETLSIRTRDPGQLVPQPDSQKVTGPSKKYAEAALTGISETPQLPWNPKASLVPHTTAPLASLISLPPLASQAPWSLQPQPLQELSLEVQEAAVLEDLLFALMGYEGQYIRFSQTYDQSIEKDRLTGPCFKILPGLDPSLSELTIMMLKMATYYRAINTFVEVHSREEYGLVNHALCAAIRKKLHDYIILIAQLETQFLTNPAFTLHLLHLHTISTSRMMSQICAVAHEILKRNSLPEEDEDLADDFDIQNILANLRQGSDIRPAGLLGKRVCKGGSVLSLITKRREAISGDPTANSILSLLLRDASRPYMIMLNEWLHYGSIKDPHGEFLIREQKSIGRERLEEDYTDEYWDRRYTIREENIPLQLEDVKAKVLLAGKYLNVVRECGRVDMRAIKETPQSFDDDRFLDNINSAYAHANESLLQLLLTTYALPARLRSLKHYFFLDRSDFFTSFLELGSSELRKPVDKVNITKLQSLLDLVVRQPGSIAAQDPFKEDIKVEMNQVSLMDSLARVVNISGLEQGETLDRTAPQPAEAEKAATGFTSLQLDYTVPFPVSLVISRKTIWRYQALFRHLLSLRHLEQQLVASWQTQNRAAAWSHKSSSKDIERLKRRVFILRARMLIFVQQLLYFCTAEVIEPNWHALMDKISAKKEEEGEGEPSTPTISTVDELMKEHVDFLDTCLKECMLTNHKLLKIHAKLMHTCTLFTTFTAWFSRALEKNDADLTGTERPASMNKQQWARLQTAKNQAGDSTGRPDDAHAPAPPLAKMQDLVAKCEVHFDRHLHIFLDALNHFAATETVALLGLCATLSAANQVAESRDA